MLFELADWFDNVNLSNLFLLHTCYNRLNMDTWLSTASLKRTNTDVSSTSKPDSEKTQHINLHEEENHLALGFTCVGAENEQLRSVFYARLVK